jgi:hypothetical protein
MDKKNLIYNSNRPLSKRGFLFQFLNSAKLLLAAIFLHPFKILAGTSTLNLSGTSSGFSSTTIILLRGNGSLVDSSSNNFPITNNGISINSSTYKYGSGSLSLASTYCSFPTNAKFNFGGAVTIEFWYHPNGYTGRGYVCDFSTMNSFPIILSPNSGGFSIEWYANESGWQINTSVSVSSALSTWTHFAFVKNGSTCMAFVNGSSIAVAKNFNASGYNFSSSNFQLGLGDSAYRVSGLIDDFCVSSIAKYTGNFSPPGAL